MPVVASELPSTNMNFPKREFNTWYVVGQTTNKNKLVTIPPTALIRYPEHDTQYTRAQ